MRGNQFAKRSGGGGGWPEVCSGGSLYISGLPPKLREWGCFSLPSERSRTISREGRIFHAKAAKNAKKYFTAVPVLGAGRLAPPSVFLGGRGGLGVKYWSAPSF